MNNFTQVTRHNDVIKIITSRKNWVFKNKKVIRNYKIKNKINKRKTNQT